MLLLGRESRGLARLGDESVSTLAAQPEEILPSFVLVVGDKACLDKW